MIVTATDMRTPSNVIIRRWIFISLFFNICVLTMLLSLMLGFEPAKPFSMQKVWTVAHEPFGARQQAKYTWKEAERPSEKKRCFRFIREPLQIKDVPESCTFIVLHNSRGRLGNNMFQIAAVFGIAHSRDMVPIIKDIGFTGDIFELPNVSPFPVENCVELEEEGMGKYNAIVETLDTSKNWTTDAYLQTWKYFIGIRHLLRTIFVIKESHIQKARRFVQRISKPGYEKVCIHARRGDMTVPSIAEEGSSPASAAYIKSARNYMGKKLNRPLQYIVISNDMVWSKNNILGDDVQFSPFNKKDIGADRALLRECDHMIVSTGTFGWWGGWFVNGTVLYSTDFPRKGSIFARGFNLNDYYPVDWVGLPSSDTDNF